MSYNIKFTDIDKSLVIEDYTVNTETSLNIPGQFYDKCLPAISENLIRLLENFAHSQPPRLPVPGQLWYDTSLNVNTLKIYNGTTWTTPGITKKSSAAPINPQIGDLWVDTVNHRVLLFTGDNAQGWIIIGPVANTTEGGLVVEQLVSSAAIPQTYSVLSLYTNNVRVAIISDVEFTPQPLVGYTVIKKGININSIIGFRFHGAATSADSILVNNEYVPGSLFLRRDRENKLAQPLHIENNNGLYVGAGKELQISVAGGVSRIESFDGRVQIGRPGLALITTNSNNQLKLGTKNVTLNDVITLADDTSVKGRLTVDSIILNKSIDCNVQLPQASSTPQLNSQERFIGYNEIETVLTGVWIGTHESEYLIIKVDDDNNTTIKGWSVLGTTLVPINPDVTGRVYRVRPFVYFYSTNSDIANETGCSLQLITVDPACRTGTLSHLNKVGCPGSYEYNNKSIALYKMSNNDTEFDNIYTDIAVVMAGWQA